MNSINNLRNIKINNVLIKDTLKGFLKQFKITINNLDIPDEYLDLINEEFDKIDFNEEDKKLFNSSIDEKEEKFIKRSDLGIYSNKSIICSLVKSNVISSNLISDIYNLEYIKPFENNGRAKSTMSLKKIEELPPFMDDCYVWSYFSKSQACKEGNRYTLKVKSNSGISDIIINEVNASIKRAFGNELYEKVGRTKIVSTPSLESDGKIKRVVKEQEEREDNKIGKQFLDFNKGEILKGIVKLKIDTSDLSIEEFQEYVNKFDDELYNKAYGLFSIDITRDYAGCLYTPFFIRELLCQGFCKEEDLFYGAKEELEREGKLTNSKNLFKTRYEIEARMEENIKKKNLQVIVNDKETRKTSGTNIVKYYYYINDRRIDVKFYNKLVSNYESRGVQDSEGTHLSEHVYNNKKVLMNTFYHPEIIEHGITRCEITINGFNKNDNINYLELLDREYERIGSKQIFFSVSFQEHWKTLVNAINKNAVFCNRATGDITMVWYASSVTEQFGGVGGNVVKSMQNLKKDLEKLETFEEKERTHQIALKEWNNGILSVVSNFGFSNMPIYVIDFDVIENDTKIRFFKHRLFMKSGPTILTPFTFPNTLYDEEIQRQYPPSVMMPDSEKVKWIWRTQELNSKKNLGTKKIYKDFFKFLEIENDEILEKIELSALSKRKRSTFEKKLHEKKIKEEYKRELEEELKRQVEISIKNKENEERLKEIAKKEKRAEKLKKEIGEDFKKPLDQQRSMGTLRRLKTFYLYGLKEGEGFTKLCYYNKEDKKNKNLCYAQGEILKQIEELKNLLFKEVDVEYIKYKKKEPVFYSPYQIIPVDCSDPLNLKIIDIEKVLKENKEDINFITIEKVEKEESPKYETLKELKYEARNAKDVDDFKENTKFSVLGFSRSSLNNTDAKFHLYVRDEKNKEFFIKGRHLQTEIFNIVSTKGELNTLIVPIILVIGEKKYDRIGKRSYNNVIFILPEITEVESIISKNEEKEEKEEKEENEEEDNLLWDDEDYIMSFEYCKDDIEEWEDIINAINE